MLPKRIEILLNAYEEKYAFVFSAYYVECKNRLIYKRLTLKKEVTLDDLFYTNIVGNQIFTTKEKFLKAGLFDEELPAAQDIDMWIRLLKIYKRAKYISKPLQIIHISNMSITNSLKKKEGYKKVYLKYKHLMSKNHRKYKIFNKYLEHQKIFKSFKYIPFFNFYTFVSIYKLLKRGK